ncbi:MAG TPA: hypothetical protein DD979_15690 [Gammaproteobacteria bacterium]|jgi:hypothetical protein|nr:hypothetical protein [Gammaproteobacteria bacterium]
MVSHARQKSDISASYRWQVLARVLLASLGGFALTSMAGAFLVVAFEQSGMMAETQAVHIMTLVGFIAWCLVAMWVFAHGHLLKLTLTMFASTLAFTGLYFLLR